LPGPQIIARRVPRSAYLRRVGGFVEARPTTPRSARTQSVTPGLRPARLCRCLPWSAAALPPSVLRTLREHRQRRRTNHSVVTIVICFGLSRLAPR
jgi:hypothetical protein